MIISLPPTPWFGTYKPFSTGHSRDIDTLVLRTSLSRHCPSSRGSDASDPDAPSQSHSP